MTDLFVSLRSLGRPLWRLWSGVSISGLLGISTTALGIIAPTLAGALIVMVGLTGRFDATADVGIV